MKKVSRRARNLKNSNDISLPRSVMRMRLIMMLNSLLFPRFFHVCSCTSNTTRSNRFQTHTHALGPPVLEIEETNNNPYLHVISYRSRRGPLSTLPRSLHVPRMKRFAFDVASCAINSRITKSRIIWASERPLSSCKQQLCLFACSTSLPAPSRAVSTWYLHKRDQPNNASCCCQSKLRTYSAKRNYEP